MTDSHDGQMTRQDNLEIFRKAVEYSTDAIGISTPQGRHYYQNRAFMELFGEIGPNPPSTLYCDPKVGNEVFKTIMAGDTWSGQVEMYAKDRSKLSVMVRAYGIKDQRGIIIGLIGIHTDITERLRTQQALSLSEDTYRQVFNAVNDAIWIHDIDTFEFIDANNRTTEMFGYSIEEVRKLTVKDISSGIAPYTQEMAESYLRRAAAGESVIFKWHTRHKDGHLFWTEVSLRRGTIAGKSCILAVERDISSRKQAEEAQKRAQSLEKLGTIAGGIAHDFNNLLLGVFGNIELAAMKIPPEHPARAMLLNAHKAMEDARHLTRRLVTFARGGTPDLKTWGLQESVRETIQFHLAGSNVATHFDIPEDLWPVRADKGQLAEVISNLSINAKEAMPKGGTLCVRAKNVTADKDAASPRLPVDAVELSFRDEGEGIPEEIFPKIFDPYFTTKQAGSGLGLAIVHSIITRHEGCVDVQSAVGVGTTVTVSIPAVTSMPLVSTATEYTYDENRLQTSGHILIMDDKENIRQTLRTMLESLGCTAITATNGEEAVSRWATAKKSGRPFDLAILDLTIPGSTGGAEAARQILKHDPEAKLIVSSGYTSDPSMFQTSEHGFCAKLFKPYSLQEICSVVARVIDLSG